MTLTPSQGLHSLCQLGVDHRDVSIGNVLLGTDPEKPAGFISDLDLSSISEEAVKAACPNDYETIIKQMKSGEWRTVCDCHFEATWTTFSHTICSQGTALFMSCDMLTSSEEMELDPDGPTASGFTSHHCYDLESLIWVVVYAMMINRRITLASTDPEKCERYKKVLDHCWAGHTYGNVLRSHTYMMSIGCFVKSRPMVSSWFPDPHEAAFFRAAMHLIRDQGEGDYITYERICTLFRDHINLAKKPQAVDVISK